MRKPEFKKPLQNLTVKDGEELLLQCIVEADPEPQISWSKNGNKISSSEIIDLKYKNGVATLKINEVYPEDEGEYVCKATNSVGSTETKCRLTVQPMANGNVKHKVLKGDQPPRIVGHLESRFVNDGEEVCLSCRIMGAKQFDVIWLHNNKEIKPSKDFQYTNEANIYKLLITEIFPEDAGTYTCEAFNDAGESFSSCQINVLVPGEDTKEPTFVKFPQGSTVQENEPAKFECEFRDSPTKVVWLKDARAIDESSSRYQFIKDGNRYKFTIKACTALDIGQYQVKAVGRKDETFASFSVNVVN